MRLIDADALYETLCHIWDRTDSEDFEKAVFREIENAPVVEERKAGKWIVYKAPDKYHCGLCKCPFCGEEMIAESDEYSFCPNCGARME